MRKLKMDKSAQGNIKMEEYDTIVYRLKSELNKAWGEVRTSSIKTEALLQEIRDLRQEIRASKGL